MDILEATEAFQRGEEKGFEFFFRTHYEALKYYAFRILNDKEEAEDILEESYVKIWKRHSSFNHHQVIKSWLYTTVRNACLNKLVEDKRKKSHHEKIERESINYQDSVLAGIIRSEVISDIHETLNVLPAECKKVFKLMYIEGLTVAETAKKLRLTVSTIKNQKFRGLEIIRKKCNLQRA